MQIRKEYKRGYVWNWNGKELEIMRLLEQQRVVLPRTYLFSLQRFLTRIFQGERGYYNKIRKERGKK